ncbi:ATP-binding protein [Methanobacterium sp. ACI-7]
MGIESQYTCRIFEVFKRLHAIDEYQVQGLVLMLLSGLLIKYEGRIWVESSLGEGSTFYFTIPMNNKNIFLY